MTTDRHTNPTARTAGTRRKKTHAAAGTRVIAGGLATSATIGLAGMMAAAAHTAPKALRLVPARPRHGVAASPAKHATARTRLLAGAAAAAAHAAGAHATGTPAHAAAPTARTAPSASPPAPNGGAATTSATAPPAPQTVPPPVTAAPVAAAPVTAPPVTAPPVTAPPVTAPPTTVSHAS